jgi:hypothetical protein
VIPGDFQMISERFPSDFHAIAGSALRLAGGGAYTGKIDWNSLYGPVEVACSYAPGELARAAIAPGQIDHLQNRAAGLKRQGRSSGSIGARLGGNHLS